tara:strand:+ start:248 stop:832 length:585 start_codon:yes stop_codon:yes gene_type:complete
MIKIQHRVNTANYLKKIPSDIGIEVDIRSNNKHLIIHHDPFEEGELFENWLRYYQHQTLILNVKEEGLEKDLIKLMKQFKINDYFFLDQSFPFLLKYAKESNGRSAVRFSEFESIETVLSLKNIVKWVWIDCFSSLSLTKTNYDILKENNFKICLVSPELQSRFKTKEITKFKSYLYDNRIDIDAVCTKNPDLW